MEKCLILIALFASIEASSILDPEIWNNLKQNDYIHPFLKEYYLLHKPDIESVDNRIVGGQIAPANAYPHQVGLALTLSAGQQSWCGGSIISVSYAITAAHCLDSVQYATIILGAHDRENPNEPGRITIMVGRANFIVHSGWNSQRMINDVALIRFPTPITFSDKIKAINLPSQSQAANNFEGQLATISGWGNYEVTTLSKYLRFTQTTVISNTICRRYFSQLVHPSNICLDGSQARGTCHGDSGGPLIIPTSDGSYILAGLTSYGNPYSCLARWPTAFTRITSFLGWISANTGIPIRN